MQTHDEKAVEALDEAARISGGRTKLAEALSISRSAVYQWDICPIKRALEIEGLTGVPRERLRPDIYARCPAE